MNDDFEHNFWGPNGIDVILQRLQHSKHSCQALEDYFKERAKLSEEYGSKLAKLAKANLGTEDIGSLQSALEILSKETEVEAQAHLDFANMFKDGILKPFSEFQNEQLNRKRNQRGLILKANKEKSGMEGNVEKLKEKYIARCKEKDALMQGKPSGLTGKDLEKYELKVKKAVASSESSDQEYLSAVMKAKTFHSSWVESHRASCQEFEGLESSRFDRFVEYLGVYLSHYNQLAQQQTVVHKKISDAMNQIDKGKDLKSWVRVNQNGSSIPQPLEYYNYYTGSSTPAAGSGKRPSEQLYMQANAVVESSGTVHSLKSGHETGVSSPAYASSGNLSEIGVADGGASGGGIAWSPIEENTGKRSGDGSPLFEVRVLYDYAPQTEEDLGLEANQLVSVLDISDDPWWFGEIKGNPNKRGVFPSNFVEKTAGA